jgi:hypothetical protein
MTFMDEILAIAIEFVLEVFGEAILDGLRELVGHVSSLQNQAGMFGL